MIHGESLQASGVAEMMVQVISCVASDKCPVSLVVGCATRQGFGMGTV